MYFLMLITTSNSMTLDCPYVESEQDKTFYNVNAACTFSGFALSRHVVFLDWKSFRKERNKFYIPIRYTRRFIYD